MVQEWRACGGRMNPRLLRSLQGDYADWMKILQNSEQRSDIGNTVSQTFYLLKSKENALFKISADLSPEYQILYSRNDIHHYHIGKR
jgi:hypothetical protein